MLESLPVEASAFLLLFVGVAVGALVQGTIGFGLNVIAAPIAAVVEPRALPAAMIILALPMTAGSALRERHAIDRRAVVQTTLGRLPGIAIGTWIVTKLEPEVLASWVGAMVVAASLMSLAEAPRTITPARSALAGAVAGIMGTTASMGGPPIALLYRGEPGPVLRSTLGAAFLIGSLLSLAALGLAGHVRSWHFALGLALTPAVGLGLFASRHLHARVDAGWLRPSIIAFACAAGLALLLTGCSAPRPTPRAAPAPRLEHGAVELGTQAQCRPRFPDEDGWLGGDAAVSVALPADGAARGGGDRTSLWFFGDSFVAASGQARERQYPFVHNSVAVSRCRRDGQFSIEYAWGTSEDPQATDAEPAASRAFFEPDPKARWVGRIRARTGGAPYYWPLAAAVVGDAVYIALLRVAPAQASGPFALPFRSVGVDLARIANPTAPPRAWQIRIAPLGTRDDALPASALVRSGDHLYAFAFLAQTDGRSPRILTRLPIAALASLEAGGASGDAVPSLEDALETLDRTGRWRRGFEPARARIVMADDATEMTVHFDPGIGRWLAVYVDPTQDPVAPGSKARPASDVLLRQAEHLEGPWSEPRPIHAMQEVTTRDDALPGRPYCYAGRAHPQFAPSGTLLLTWVCNLFAAPGDAVPAVLERLRNSPELYRPHAVRVPVPPDA